MKEYGNEVELRIGGEFVFSVAGLPPGYEFNIKIRRGAEGPRAMVYLPQGGKAVLWRLSVTGPVWLGPWEACPHCGNPVGEIQPASFLCSPPR